MSGGASACLKGPARLTRPPARVCVLVWQVGAEGEG